MANRSLCTNQAVYMIFILQYNLLHFSYHMVGDSYSEHRFVSFLFFWGGGGEIVFIYKLGSDAWNLCSSHRFFRICRVVGLIDSLPDFQCPTSGSSQRPNSYSSCVNQPYITPLNRLQEQVEKTKCRIHFYREFIFFLIQPVSWSVTQTRQVHKQQPLHQFSWKTLVKKRIQPENHVLPHQWNKAVCLYFYCLTVRNLNRKSIMLSLGVKT